MARQAHRTGGSVRSARSASDWTELVGLRYWTASLLPALTGSTLPFWLRETAFTFRWGGAVEFLMATALAHAGFSLVRACETGRAVGHPVARLVALAVACLVAAVLLGWHLNTRYGGLVFGVFGLAVFATGLLYVTPPVCLGRRAAGDITLAYGLGMLPVLGAYVVQTGDLTRTVYVASMPIVVSTGLWVWALDVESLEVDRAQFRETLATAFGSERAVRVVTVALAVLLFASLFVAVVSSSVSPWALAGVLSLAPVRRVVIGSGARERTTAWDPAMGRDAFFAHLVVSGALALSSLPSALR